MSKGPIKKIPEMDLVERMDFWRIADKSPGQGPDGDCWEWGAGNSYGVFLINGKPFRAHRVSYFLTHGEIPDGLFVCHTCDNPPCVRPGHLFAGSAGDNARDRFKKAELLKGPQVVRTTRPRKRGPRDLLLPSEVAEQIKVPTCKIKEMFENRTIEGYRIGKLSIRFSQNQVDEYLAREKA